MRNLGLQDGWESISGLAAACIYSLLLATKANWIKFGIEKAGHNYFDTYGNLNPIDWLNIVGTFLFIMNYFLN